MNTAAVFAVGFLKFMYLTSGIPNGTVTLINFGALAVFVALQPISGSRLRVLTNWTVQLRASRGRERL